VTPQALKGFFDHLQRISTEAPGEGELSDAKRLLVDSFPLQIETPGEIAGLVSDLRAYNFPDNYWDGFRSQIQSVASPQALQAAKQYIRPDSSLVVVVGRAAAIREALASYGAVKVIDTDGKLVVSTPAPAASTSTSTAQPAASAAHPAVPETKPEPPKDAK
jgi:hypothetical protein